MCKVQIFRVIKIMQTPFNYSLTPYYHKELTLLLERFIMRNHESEATTVKYHKK